MTKIFKLKDQVVEIILDKTSTGNEMHYKIVLNKGAWETAGEINIEGLRDYTTIKRVIKSNFLLELKAAIAIANVDLDDLGNDYLDAIIEALN